MTYRLLRLVDPLLSEPNTYSETVVLGKVFFRWIHFDLWLMPMANFQGNWTCRVWNNEGSTSRNFSLHIVGRFSVDIFTCFLPFLPCTYLTCVFAHRFLRLFSECAYPSEASARRMPLPMGSPTTRFIGLTRSLSTSSIAPTSSGLGFEWIPPSGSTLQKICQSWGNCPASNTAKGGGSQTCWPFSTIGHLFHHKHSKTH